MLTQYSKDMERVMKALNPCRNLHEGQVDKCGQPYWIHPFTVAMRSFTGYNRNENQTSTMIVGLLHDIPEDTGIAVGALTTLIDLTDKEQEALELLTRKNGTSYNDYIETILQSNNKIAIEVKTDDLLHNSDLCRFIEAGIEVSEKDEGRSQKYREYLYKFLAKLNEEEI